MHDFTPFSALAGGALIGLAAALLMALSGRIAGVSGIAGGLLQPESPADAGWRLAFVAGLALGALLYAMLAGRPPAIRIEASVPEMAAAGLLVGYGTRIGGGCTSGHGVCGIARGSPRSLVATLAFIGAGFATVFVLRHLVGG